ncbi:MAG TPA: hypothetical protein VJK25_03910 [Patescibacteria group bacterium]|nr:hypothetical protein [Patescibacteria group bacterium]
MGVKVDFHVGILVVRRHQILVAGQSGSEDRGIQKHGCGFPPLLGSDVKV